MIARRRPGLVLHRTHWIPALYSAFGQSEVSIIYTELNQYYVVLEAAPQFWQIPGRIELHLSFRKHERQRAVERRRNGAGREHSTASEPYRVVSVSDGLIQHGAGDVFQRCDAAVSTRCKQRLNTPSTLRGFFAGTVQAYQQSLKTEPILVLTALLAVYIVLGILYESLVHPLTIISTLPSASVGAMLALMLFKIDLNVISIIGIVLLIGIVKKNAIMMIDFALVAERERA